MVWLLSALFFLRPFKDLGLWYWKLVISFIFVTLPVLLPNQRSTSKVIHILLWKTFGLEATSWDCRTLGKGCCGPFKRSVGVQRAIEGGAGNSDSGASVPAPGGGGSQQLTCQCGWLPLATGYFCWSCTDFRARPLPARVECQTTERGQASHAGPEVLVYVPQGT